MRIKGKVSWWFYAMIIGIGGILIPIMIMALIDGSLTVLIFNAIIFLALEIFCISIVFHNYVELQEDSLLVVFGFIKQNIPYSDIVTLARTSNPSSSLAASFDRIEIQCKKQSNIMISVINKDTFFNEMKKRNSSITIL